jgi:hypothetical protein
MVPAEIRKHSKAFALSRMDESLGLAIKSDEIMPNSLARKLNRVESDEWPKPETVLMSSVRIITGDS